MPRASKPKPTPADPLSFYKDSAGKWRWRVTHPNGRILADSGDGYTRHIDARRGAASSEDLLYRSLYGRVKAR